MTSRLFTSVFSASAALAPAAPLTWDSNGATAGQTNGGGSWFGSGLWWNGTANQDWVSDSDAIFGGANTNGGIVTLPGPTSVGSITFNTFTGTYTIGTAGQALAISGGINKTSGAAAVSLTASPITLGGAQTWTNNSAGAFNATAPVNNNGHLLTIDGNGTTNFGTATTGVISGAGGITYNGTGRLFLGAGQVPAHTYSGTTTLNGGVTMVSNNNLGTGDLVLDGGVIESYWTTNFTRPLGNDLANTTPEVQIVGGASGFGNNNGGNSIILGNNAGYEAVWGVANEAGNTAATGFFNPSTFVLNTQYTQNTGITFQNKIDLNGTTRTIQAGAGTAGGAAATISGVIRNTRGTAAGLIKTGPGLLILTGANIYNGGTTITQGILRFGSLAAMPSSGNVTVNAGATLALETGGTGDWTNGASGVGTLGGLFSGLGSAGSSTVSFDSDATLGLEMTGNLAYAGDIPDLGTNVGITKSGGSSLTLTGNSSYTGRTRVNAGTLSFNSLANVGGGNSALGAPTTAANGTINIGSGGTAATISYTGSGHSTDRVVNLSGSTGGATIDASGTGPLILTSSLTAAAGAKTLILTGGNTGDNSLAAADLASLSEVLTVQKTGAGTWLINGFSSQKNAWTVSAGTLVANAAIATGDQNFTVSGGTLAGNGPVTLQAAKTLTVQAAGSVAPGHTSVGTLAVAGILNLSGMANGSGKLNFQMGSPAASDRIAVTGTAQIGTGLLGLNDFVFTDLGGMTASTYILISTSGGITGTLDPANRIGSIGSITGALQINGNNLEFTIDSDLDGIPDSYELANTTPPSPTGFNPGDDLDTDDSTNLQEYLAGTNPNLSDTDGDGFKDGWETNTGTWISSTNTGTKPLVFDTDGDTIRDGYETNTGTWAGPTDTGSNPLKMDTDGDSLRDNVETGTSTLVGRSNTGTNPNLPDTDGDGAGDWYEVAIIDKNPALGALPNSPNDANLKPNIPYPLPDPDSSTGATNKPVKVYIMSGQSNMVGIGYVAGGAGSLDTIAKTEGKFPHLVNASNAYNTRSDVRYRGVVTAIGNAQLAPGQGANSGQMGPELGFGHVMGYHHDEPVLLLKSSEGNRSLSWDILPPGSPPYIHTDGYTYAGYGQSPDRWLTTTGGPAPSIWHAGKQYDDFFKAENDFGAVAWNSGIAYVYDPEKGLGSQVTRNGQVYICKLSHTSSAASEPVLGAQWTTYWNAYSITNVVDVLDGFAAQYPQWATQGFEIAGFVWWQGHKDQGQPSATRYQSGMLNLISSLRTYYGNRYPGKIAANAPFVLGTIGFGGWTLAGDGLQVANAQLAVSNPANKVKTIETRSFWRELSESPGSQGHHYNNNAETYMLTGEALGRAMIDLQAATGGNTYATWIAGFPSVPSNLTGFDQDADGDGIDNGAEYFFGTNPGVGAAGLIAGASTGNTFTFTHPQNANPATGVTAAYRWSKDLATFRNGGQTDGDGTTVNFNAVTSAGVTTVTASITGTAATRLFVDVNVTQN